MTRTERKQKTIQNHTDRPTKQQSRQKAEQKSDLWQQLLSTTFTLTEIRNHRNLNQVRFNIS